MTFSYRRSYCGSIKAVVLDWAGTAVDFGSFAPTAVFIRLFESQGVQISAEDARSGMGLMKKDHLRVIFSQEKVAETWEDIKGKPPEDADIDLLYENFVPMQAGGLKEYAKPIPGLLDVTAELKARGIKTGSTTGYLRSMMDVLGPEAASNGYQPDLIVSSDDVRAGRPYPWMMYKNVTELEIYPMEAVVKVGDTLPDIAEGLNAGAWTVGLTLTGNFLGASEEDFQKLSANEKDIARSWIGDLFYQAGAHFVVDGIWDLIPVLDEIDSRLRQGIKH